MERDEMGGCGGGAFVEYERFCRCLVAFMWLCNMLWEIQKDATGKFYKI